MSTRSGKALDLPPAGAYGGDVTLLPFASPLFADIVSTAEMRAVWTEERMLGSWMEVERALVTAQAELGMIPVEAARTIAKRLDLETLPATAVLAKKASIGHPMVAFLKAFREVCGPAAEHLHVGPTTQDALDTGLTLQIRSPGRTR